MKVVILAGGIGSRMGDETRIKPKAMVEIGGLPILIHIINIYSHYGFNEFIVCAGYKCNYLIDNLGEHYHIAPVKHDDFAFAFHSAGNMACNIMVVDTGESTQTGGRLKRVQKYIGDQTIMLTYGDGLCDVDLTKLLHFHRAHGKQATITAVKWPDTIEKGVADIDTNGLVRAFHEKGHSGELINAGFMVLEPRVFNYLSDDNSILEVDAMMKLCYDRELMAYRHDGFWQCMDSVEEKEYLESLVASGTPPWM